MFTLRFSHFWPTTSLLHAVRAHLSVFPIFGLLWLIQRRVEEPLLPCAPTTCVRPFNRCVQIRSKNYAIWSFPLWTCHYCAAIAISIWLPGPATRAKLTQQQQPTRQPTPPCVVAVGSVAGPSSVIIGDWCFITRGDSSILKWKMNNNKQLYSVYLPGDWSIRFYGQVDERKPSLVFVCTLMMNV